MYIFRNIGYCKFESGVIFSHIVKKDPELEKIKEDNRTVEELEKLCTL